MTEVIKRTTFQNNGFTFNNNDQNFTQQFSIIASATDGDKARSITFTDAANQNNVTDLFLKGVRTPEQASDAANKSYVDNVAQGLDVKPSCRVSSVDAEALNGGEVTNAILQQIASETDNNITLNGGDLVLVRHQTGGDVGKNGIYVFKANAAAANSERAPGFQAATNQAGAFVFVEEGASKNQGFVATMVATKDGAGAFVEQVGTHDPKFTQFSGAASIQATNGVKRNNQNLEFDASTITSNVNFPASAPVSVANALTVTQAATFNGGASTTTLTCSSTLSAATGSSLGNLTFANGSITDSSGAISFDDENLSTTGTLGCGVLTAATGSVVGNLTLANGSITDSSGAISFGNENLSTTGTLGCGVLTAATGSAVGNLTLANGSITDSSGAISFGNEALSTTGTLGCGVLTAATGSAVGTLTLADGSITDSSGAISFGDEALSTTGTLGCGVLTAATGSKAGTLTLADGSITDSSGAISFGNEALSTTGTLGCGVLTAATGSVVGNLTLANGSIKDSSGAISFDDENLSTTGTLGCGVLTAATGSVVGNLTLANGSIKDSSGAISFDDENLSTTGTLGCGATTITGNCSVSENMSAKQYTATSDRRLKQDIKYITPEDALRQVMHMRPATYQFKSDPSKQRQGVIAQELQVIAPTLVDTANRGSDKEHLVVNYIDMISSLIGAVQGLQAQIDRMKAE